MKPKAFWSLAAFSAVIVMLVCLLGYNAVRIFDAEPTQAYRDWSIAADRYDRWFASRNLDPRQVRFDEVLAGRAPPESISNPATRFLAEQVRTLAFGIGDVNERVKIVGSLFIHNGGLGTRYWTACNQYDGRWNVNTCGMQPEVATLGNPERLNVLFGTDEGAKRAVLPIVPEEFRQRPVWSGGDERRWPLFDRVSALPGEWRWIGAWIVLSTLFTFVFFLRGYGRHRKKTDGTVGELFDEESEKYPDPFKTVPHFLLGWIVYLAMLPGVIFMQALRLVTFDAQPALRWAKNGFMRRTFASEYERTLAHLDEIRAKAASYDQSKEIVRMIDKAIAKVKEAKNLEELDKLRLLARDIECAHEAQIELRETLSA
jgi:hypothetical protein